MRLGCEVLLVWRTSRAAISKTSRCTRTCSTGYLERKVQEVWTLAHAISYDAIKYDIAWSKGLYQIDYKLPIFVCTDACKEGIGGYIYQKLPGSDEERVVLYFSRSTADAEKQWDARELELLAAIATMEQFQYYLDVWMISASL